MSNLELYEKFKEDLRNYLFKLVFIFVIFMFGYVLLWPTDSTDSSRLDRSNLVLHIDNKTGCQYLASAYGGITARLDKDGNHICTGAE